MENKDKIKDIIENIFKYTSCTLTSCDFSSDGGMLWCAIETPDSNFMIGRDGETLRSISHLVQKIIEKEIIESGNSLEDKKPSFFLDINGYQKKRFDNLKTTAYMMAERARYFKSDIRIDPMPAYERRIIHMFLEGAKDIKTESEGLGENRRVVIKYIDNSL